MTFDNGSDEVGWLVDDVFVPNAQLSGINHFSCNARPMQPQIRVCCTTQNMHDERLLVSISGTFTVLYNLCCRLCGSHMILRDPTHVGDTTALGTTPRHPAPCCLLVQIVKTKASTSQSHKYATRSGATPRALQVDPTSCNSSS